MCVKAVAVYINSDTVVLSGTAGLQRHRSLGKTYQTLPHENRQKMKSTRKCVLHMLPATSSRAEMGQRAGGPGGSKQEGVGHIGKAVGSPACPRVVSGTHLPMSPRDGWYERESG